MTVIAEKKTEGLSSRQKTGIRICLSGLISVLALFLGITINGKPIALIGTIDLTLVYQIGVYVPVFVVVLLALRRLH